MPYPRGTPSLSTLEQFSEFALVVRRLRPFLGAERVRLAAVLGSSLFVMVFEGAGVGLLVPLLSLLLGGENATPMRPLQWLERQLPGHSPAFYVAVVCVAIVVAIAAKNAAAYTSQVLAADLKKRIAINVRDGLFRRLHSADLDVFDRSPGGEIANVFLVESYRMTLAIDVLVATLQRTSIACFYLGALFYISWVLTLIVLLLAFAIGGALTFVYRRITSARSRAHGSQSPDRRAADPVVCRRAHRPGDELPGARDRRVPCHQHRAGDRGRTEHARLLAAVPAHRDARGRRRDADCLLRVRVLRQARPHAQQLPAGLRLHAAAAAAVAEPALRTAGPPALPGGGVREVQRWLDTPVYPERPFGTRTYTALERALRFERVSYAYPNGTPALQDVDFTVPVGQTVALVGASGSGKSTLAAILLRFRAPTSGRVTVDGVDYWEFSPESWHRATALVEQDAFLFHGTLRDNIVYGCATVDRGEHPARHRGREPVGRRRRDAEGARHAGRRTRRDGLGRTASADRHRAGRHPQSIDSDSGRSHVAPGRRVRTARAAGADECVTRPDDAS